MQIYRLFVSIVFPSIVFSQSCISNPLENMALDVNKTRTTEISVELIGEFNDWTEEDCIDACCFALESDGCSIAEFDRKNKTCRLFMSNCSLHTESCIFKAVEDTILSFIGINETFIEESKSDESESSSVSDNTGFITKTTNVNNLVLQTTSGVTHIDSVDLSSNDTDKVLNTTESNNETNKLLSEPHIEILGNDTKEATNMSNISHKKVSFKENHTVSTTPSANISSETEIYLSNTSSIETEIALSNISSSQRSDNITTEPLTQSPPISVELSTERPPTRSIPTTELETSAAIANENVSSDKTGNILSTTAEITTTNSQSSNASSTEVNELPGRTSDIRDNATDNISLTASTTIYTTSISTTKVNTTTNAFVSTSKVNTSTPKMGNTTVYNEFTDKYETTVGPYATEGQATTNTGQEITTTIPFKTTSVQETDEVSMLMEETSTNALTSALGGNVTGNKTNTTPQMRFHYPHFESPESAAMSGALIAAVSFGVMFLFSILVLLGKRCFDSWQRRHYSRMDYLINGMYN